MAPPAAESTAPRRPLGPWLLPLLPAHLVGLGAFQLALVCGLAWGPWGAAVPLFLFVLACAVAPFWPGSGLFGPVLRRGSRTLGGVALTVDDGPDPATTPALLDLLARRSLRATFFVVGERARRHPELLRRIAAAGHGLGNHSDGHSPWLMLRSTAALRADIEAAQEVFAPLGLRPLAFRPPVGIVNPRLRGVLLQLGMLCVGFSRRGRDFGNRRVAGLARRLLRGLRPGDVLLLHDGPLPAGASAGPWLREVEAVLDGVQERGLRVLPLDQVLGRPLCEVRPARAEADPQGGGLAAVRVFYDGLAADYDAEQDRAGAAGLRGRELAEVLARLRERPLAGARVLELGAGTGRFTLELLRLGAQVDALDLSAAMLERLRRKAEAEGLGARLRVEQADLAHWQPPEQTYDWVVSFSALEYLRQIDTVLPAMAAALRPGGELLLTTARRSWMRFFVQIGNALRQGVWLCARREGALRAALRAAGLERLELRGFGLAGVCHGGLVLLAHAQRRENSRRAD